MGIAVIWVVLPRRSGHPRSYRFARSRALSLREGGGSAWRRSSPCPLLKEEVRVAGLPCENCWVGVLW